MKCIFNSFVIISELSQWLEFTSHRKYLGARHNVTHLVKWPDQNDLWTNFSSQLWWRELKL